MPMFKDNRNLPSLLYYVRVFLPAQRLIPCRAHSSTAAGGPVLSRVRQGPTRSSEHPLKPRSRSRVWSSAQLRTAWNREGTRRSHFRSDLTTASGDIVVRDQVKVLVVSKNDDPVVTDQPAGRIEVMAGNIIKPFDGAGTTLEDTDLNDEITVRIELDDAAKGDLVDSSGRFAESPDGSGIYLATGSAGDVEAALQGLEFQLKPGYPVPAGEPGIEVEFRVTVTDRQAAKVEFSFQLLVLVDQVVRVVTNTADTGAGSLRQAIAEATDNDHIAFDLSAVFATQLTATIRLQSPLIIDKNLTDRRARNREAFHQWRLGRRWFGRCADFPSRGARDRHLRRDRRLSAPVVRHANRWFRRGQHFR